MKLLISNAIESCKKNKIAQWIRKIENLFYLKYFVYFLSYKLNRCWDVEECDMPTRFSEVLQFNFPTFQNFGSIWESGSVLNSDHYAPVSGHYSRFYVLSLCYYM